MANDPIEIIHQQQHYRRREDNGAQSCSWCRWCRSISTVRRKQQRLQPRTAPLRHSSGCSLLLSSSLSSSSASPSSSTSSSSPTTTKTMHRTVAMPRTPTTAALLRVHTRTMSKSTSCLGSNQQQQHYHHRRRRRRHPAASVVSSSSSSSSCSLTTFIFSILLFLQPRQFITRLSHHNHHQRHQGMMTIMMMAHGYVITWNNGPEDKFFCGTTYDDPTTDCTLRQNCRSGRDDECDGYADGLGIKCFAETPCDSKNGGGSLFVPHSTTSILVPTSGPTAASGALTSENFEHTSDHPSDHWFCGVGFDDAEERCEVHCPNQTGCPIGEICYFGTSCDARSDPPTARPTRSPTMEPTTKAAARPGPTIQPTHPPLTEVQSGFFCGTSWEDVTTNCKKRCPSGEDPECPGDETCFAFTGCAQENGYGADPEGWVPGYDEWGNALSEAEGFISQGNDKGDEQVDDSSCVQTVVTITADNWPQEITWTITNVETGEEVAAGINDDLVPLEPLKTTHCLPILSKTCYQFTIKDGAGDGICCGSGDGSYTVKYDGKIIKEGAAFYDSESVEFGCDANIKAEETTAVPSPRPTKKRLGSSSSSSSNSPSMSSDAEEASTSVPSPSPTEKRLGNSSNQQGSSSEESSAPRPSDLEVDDQTMSESPTTTTADKTRPTTSSPSKSSIVYLALGDNDSSSDSPTSTSQIFHRCVAKELVDNGYHVTDELCDAYIDCYNKYIEMGDAWYCAEDEVCIETDCGIDSSSSTVSTLENSSEEETTGVIDESGVEATDAPAAPAPLRPTSPTVSKPVATPTTLMPTTMATANTSTEDSPLTNIPTNVRVTIEPTGYPTETLTLAPSVSPTETPLGPCEGDPCPISTYCRSQYGFCGPGEDYCTDTAIWSKDCSSNEPTQAPTATMTFATSRSEFTPSSVPRGFSPSPSISESATTFEKPQGGGKGKIIVTDSPSSASKSDNDTTLLPTIYSDIEDIVDINSDSSQFIVISNSPTYAPSATGSMQTNSATSTPAPVEKNEFSCTGEPCEESSWCRSRYGSCGPGFIYCNANTIWDNSCPPIALAMETRPTRTPTIQLTEEPTILEEELGGVSAPTLPALPMPTLPTIIGGTDTSANFMSQSSVELHAPSSSEEIALAEDDSIETAVSDEMKAKEAETELPKETDGSSMGSTQTPGFDEWLAFTASMNTGTAWHVPIHLCVLSALTIIVVCELPWIYYSYV